MGSSCGLETLTEATAETFPRQRFLNLPTTAMKVTKRSSAVLSFRVSSGSTYLVMCGKCSSVGFSVFGGDGLYSSSVDVVN